MSLLVKRKQALERRWRTASKREAVFESRDSATVPKWTGLCQSSPLPADRTCGRETQPQGSRHAGSRGQNITSQGWAPGHNEVLIPTMWPSLGHRGGLYRKRVVWLLLGMGLNGLKFMDLLYLCKNEQYFLFKLGRHMGQGSGRKEKKNAVTQFKTTACIGMNLEGQVATSTQTQTSHLRFFSDT